MADPRAPGAGRPPGPAAAGPQVAPGWYPDPASGQLRWWDGRAWGAFAPAPPPPGPPGAPPGSGALGAPPGYGAPTGYGAPAPSQQNPLTMAMLAHLLGLLVGFIGPLIIMLTSGAQDPFVKDQSTEALNFQITMVLASLVAIVLAFVLIGFFLLPVILIGNLVFTIQGAVAANKGQWYRYPVSLRLVK